MSVSDISLEQNIVEQISHWLDEHYPAGTGLRDLKKGAIARFEALGLPARKSENYKYTPITKHLEKNFDFKINPYHSQWSKSKCEAHFYPDKDANHLVFVNGMFLEDFSTIKSTSNDLEIRLIDDKAFQEHQGLRELLGKADGAQEDAFYFLNLSYFNQGLYIKAHSSSDNKPIYIYKFIDRDIPAPVYPRVVVESESNSRTHIFEKTIFEGDANPHLLIPIFEGKVASNAELHYTKLQNYDSATYSIEGIYIHQAQDSRFYSNTATFKAGVLRNNIYIAVDAENCEAHMYGLYQLSGSSHVDNNTSVDHLKAHSMSNELYKGVLDDQARAVFNGKIYVRPDAQKTNAFQSNNNILLSDTATINTKPQLEIWADDVKCSHGCTTGQLDEDAIFYLRARGIEKRKAKALLLNAFVNETIKQVGSDLMRAEMEELILAKLS